MSVAPNLAAYFDPNSIAETLHAVGFTPAARTKRIVRIIRDRDNKVALGGLRFLHTLQLDALRVSGATRRQSAQVSTPSGDVLTETRDYLPALDPSSSGDLPLPRGTIVRPPEHGLFAEEPPAGGP